MMRITLSARSQRALRSFRPRDEKRSRKSGAVAVTEPGASDARLLSALADLHLAIA